MCIVCDYSFSLISIFIVKGTPLSQEIIYNLEVERENAAESGHVECVLH